MTHPLDDGTELINPMDGTPYTEIQRFGFYTGLQQVLDTQYQRDRKQEYPPIEEYIDGENELMLITRKANYLSPITKGF